MAATMQVELVSPEKVLYSGEATIVVCRPQGGDAAFLPGHAPFLGLLGVGPVSIRTVDGREVKAAVHGGFIEVRNNKVTILSDVAELATDIDVTRARTAKSKADAAGAGSDNALAARRASVRLQVAGAEAVAH
jgi:F-type H+-transporting ATPase subunit epsilon